MTGVPFWLLFFLLNLPFYVLAVWRMFTTLGIDVPAEPHPPGATATSRIDAGNVSFEEAIRAASTADMGALS